MNRAVVFLLLLVVLFGKCAAQRTELPVVIELFTSQGCSSCPAADTLLTNLQQEFEDEVIVLAFHVDYWDRLGWKDVFASPLFTERQRWYADKIPFSNVYTPQAVIGGMVQGVGSNEDFLRKNFRNFRLRRSEIHLATEMRLHINKVELSLEMKGYSDDSELLIALVQDGTEILIRDGENAGKKLEYNHVVRSFAMLKPAEKLSTTLRLPDKFDADESSMVLIVQNKKSGEIQYAKRFDLD